MARIKVFLFLIFMSASIFCFSDSNLKGDVRYRLENINDDSSEARFRHRVRARVGAYGQAQDNFKYGIRLVTGADNPVSTNQSLDTGFSNKIGKPNKF